MLKKLAALMKNREFISVATCNPDGRPNAAPKFFLKIKGPYVYLIDYTRGKTWNNLKNNPHVSLSLTDTEALLGYQINGTAELIEHGQEYEEVFGELLTKEIDLSAKRIMEGVVSAKKHKAFEVALTNKFAILKINIEDILELSPRGEVERWTV